MLESLPVFAAHGSNDEARAAYREALTLFKQFDNQLGQGHVQRGLGGLESKRGADPHRGGSIPAADINRRNQHTQSARGEQGRLV